MLKAPELAWGCLGSSRSTRHTQEPIMPAVKVYNMSGSPFGWRVQLSLHEKGLAFETVILSIASGDLRSEEHLARCP